MSALDSALRDLNPNLLPNSEGAGMLGAFAARRLKDADRSDALAWMHIKDQDAWEAFRNLRLSALSASLGDLPAEEPEFTAVNVSRELKGDGFKIQCLTYSSRPGDPVSANLYVPDPLPESLPGILLCHSHHRPKEQQELQDMGMTWARCGCYVLVPDMLGYSERRHQPYEGRQEYYFRYDLGMQLHLAGESLIGRYVWDLWRGVDVLLQQERADAERIVLMGAVAGGGDPAAVAAALDKRIACAVPFNFGGPQPETPVSSSEQASAFSFTGRGGWESTRNLKLSACDGFLPWVVVASLAPRHLIYAHEFAWNSEVDPVWTRLLQIYAWHGVPERLGSVAGKGNVKLRPPEATHCNQIGAPHRAQIYPALEAWFGIAAPKEEYHRPREAHELAALDEGAERVPAHKQAYASAERKMAAQRKELAALPHEARRARLRELYARVLMLPERAEPQVRSLEARDALPGAKAERLVFATEAGIEVPTLLLLPGHGKRAPLVVALAQEGKARLLRERAGEIARLIADGVAVCLPDLRGCGESDPDGDRSWFGKATAHSSSELMLGRTQLGNRLHDLAGVLAHLQTRSDLDPDRFALWGESFAAPNPAGFESPPHRGGARSSAEQPPVPPALIGEPGAGLLALLGALFEPWVRAVFARRTLASWLSVLETPFVHLPHEVVVPGIAEAGDICDLAGALAPRAVALEGCIDGRNVLLNATHAGALLAEAKDAYAAHGGGIAFTNDGALDPGGWLADALHT